MGAPTPWEFNGWIPESMSWKVGAYIHAGLSGPMLKLSGPNARTLLERVSINGYGTFPVESEKHAIMLTEEGTVAAHGLLQRSGDEEYILSAGGVWPL